MPVTNELVTFRAYWRQFDSLPTSFDTHKDWYGRMAAIFDVWVENNNNGSLTAVHGFTHAEDNHIGTVDGTFSPPSTASWGRLFTDLNGDGDIDANEWGKHVAYCRIGYIKAATGYSFLHVDGNASSSNNPSPLIESWMTEEILKNLAYGGTRPLGWDPGGNGWQREYDPNTIGHGKGCRHPSVVESNNYLYLFYDQIISASYVEVLESDGVYDNKDKSLVLPNGQSVRDRPSICVARASVADFKNYTGTSGQTSPWRKYFDGQYDSNQMGVGGYSSPIIVSPFRINRALEMPHVNYNGELGKFIMLAVGMWEYPSGGITIKNNRIYLFLDDTESSEPPLTQWSPGLRLDDIYTDTGGPVTPDTPFYPMLVCRQSAFHIGDTNYSYQNNYLYYGNTGFTSFADWLKRVQITFVNN